MNADWLASLADDARELAFALMREVGEEADRHMKAAQRADGDGVLLPVGAGHFDDLLAWCVRWGFLSALRRGCTPAESCAAAKLEARTCVARHNARRPREVTWQRWEGAGDTEAERLRERFEALS